MLQRNPLAWYVDIGQADEAMLDRQVTLYTVAQSRNPRCVIDAAGLEDAGNG